MIRSKLVLMAFVVCAIAASGWTAVLTDDVNTVALWHMDAITSQGSPARNYILDDDSAAPVNWRNHDLLLGWTSADVDFEPTVVAGQAGYGNCLSFDGINDSAYLPNGWSGYTTVKADFWVKPGANAYLTDPNKKMIVTGGPWWVCIEPNTTKPLFETTVYGTNCFPYFPAKLTLPAQVGVWQHVILNVSNGTMTLTVDGTSVSSPLYGGALDTTVTGNLSVGNSVDIFGAYGRAFQGLIDEVKITTKKDFAAPFTDGTTTKGLWHFNSVDSATYQFMDDDSTHLTRNANMDRYVVSTKQTDTTSAPTSVDPSTFIPPYGETNPVGYPAANSAFGNCVYFDGLNKHCQVTNTSMPAIDGNNLTIQFWMRADDALTKWADGADHYYQLLYRQNQVFISLREYRTNAHMQIQVQAYNKNGSNSYSVLPYDLDSHGLDYKQWFHVKFTCVGNACTLYINGISVSTATLANLTGVTGLHDLAGNGAPYTYVGQAYNQSQAFWGFVDELKIDSTAHCGDLPYSVGDFDQNCKVDFNDIRVVAQGWLSANSYSGNSGSSNYPALVEQKWGVGSNINVPHATVTPTIDGTFNASEWADARTIELIYPTLVTAPNIGTVRLDSGRTYPTNPADFSQYWYVKWASDYLYVACVCYDNDVNPNATFDEPQIGFNYLNITTHTYLSQAYLWNFKSDNTWNTNTPHNGGPTITPSSDTRFVRVNNPAGLAGYVIEAKLKWSDLACDNPAYVPAAGDKHGFDLCSMDFDLLGNATHWLISSPGISAINLWNTITLVNTIDCHDKLQSLADINSDCTVNFKDFAALAANWLVCTDPSGVKCH